MASLRPREKPWLSETLYETTLSTLRVVALYPDVFFQVLVSIKALAITTANFMVVIWSIEVDKVAFVRVLYEEMQASNDHEGNFLSGIGKLKKNSIDFTDLFLD